MASVLALFCVLGTSTAWGQAPGSPAVPSQPAAPAGPVAPGDSTESQTEGKDSEAAAGTAEQPDTAAPPAQPAVVPDPATTAAAVPAPAPELAAVPASSAAPVLRPSALATLVAVVPGFLVHGAGHYLAGDRRTARTLVRVELFSLGLMGVSGAALGLSGASRRLSPPAVPLLIGSTGTFLMSWFADIYGAAGGPRLAGTAPGRLPGLEARLGYLYVYDPQFQYRHFADASLAARLGPWRLGAAAQLAMNDDNQRVRVSADYRVAGALRRGQARDGTSLDVQAAGTLHRYGSDDFSVTAADVVAHGRYDLGRVSPSLTGAFAELSLGLNLDFIDYSAGKLDVSDQGLARFGFGMYLGNPLASHGEALLFYDHRRDDFAGALALPGGSNGFIGSFGLDGYWLLGGRDTSAPQHRWGLAGRAQVGAAYVINLGLLYTMP